LKATALLLSNLALPLAAICAVGCGVVQSAEPARGVYDIAWHESFGSGRQRIVFTVTRIVVRPPRWRVTASVANRTTIPLLVDRPHRPGQTLFGVLPFRTATRQELQQTAKDVRYRAPSAASSFRPSLPRELLPGATWRGVFSGLGSFRRGSYLRVEFGRFVPYGPLPRGLYRGMIEVTDHALKLRR
jgi:hypothetical protein